MSNLDIDKIIPQIKGDDYYSKASNLQRSDFILKWTEDIKLDKSLDISIESLLMSVNNLWKLPEDEQILFRYILDKLNP
jgi:hypothetical protein